MWSTRSEATSVAKVATARRSADSSLVEWVAVYRAAFAMTFGVQLQYRVALAIWLLGLVLTPIVSLVVWMTVASSSGGQAGGIPQRGSPGTSLR
jgi:hypothetical protein